MRIETLKLLEEIATSVLAELYDEKQRHETAMDSIAKKAAKLQSNLSMILAIQEQQEAKP